MTLLDRKYVSRYLSATFGITIYKAGVLAAADGDVTVTLFADGEITPETGWPKVATTSQVGSYEVSLSSADTSTQGYYSLRWDYEIDGDPQIYMVDIEVGPSSPEYDSLSPTWRASIERVWVRFADLFDSPFGGPNLQTYAVTHFGRNRLAQLMRPALDRLNQTSGGFVSYEYGGTSFPFAAWSGLLDQSLYIEVLKHFVRSFVEQPEVALATVVSRLDRRDYMQRWKEVLDMESSEFQLTLSRYRTQALTGGLPGSSGGAISVLVAGGAFGNYGPIANPGGAGEAAARGYFHVGRWH